MRVVFTTAPSQEASAIAEAQGKLGWSAVPISLKVHGSIGMGRFRRIRNTYLMETPDEHTEADENAI